LRDFQASKPCSCPSGVFAFGTNPRFARLEFECQATFTIERPCPPPAGFFSAKELVMDEGFPPHIVGFMRRKREKEKDTREEQPSQS
jgi:hypothetical protein